MYNDQLPNKLQQHFIKEIYRNMRAKYNFIIPNINRKIYKLSNNIQAIKVWNDLSNNTKLSPTLSPF